MQRIFEPPEILSDNLVLVSVLGLLVNMVGLVFFHEWVVFLFNLQSLLVPTDVGACPTVFISCPAHVHMYLFACAATAVMATATVMAAVAATGTATAAAT